MPRQTIFISYSHKDTGWMNELVKYLNVIGEEWELKPWVDTEIQPGDEWFEKIQEAMASAKMALLLISVDFLDSNFIKREEIPALLREQRERGLRIIPIILKASPWKYKKWIEQRQALPAEGKPLEEFPGNQQARELNAIAEAVWKLFQEEEARQVGLEEVVLPFVPPTRGQTNARSALERARTQRESRTTAPSNTPIDHLNLIRCDLNQQVGSFKLHLTSMGCHAFFHAGDFSMIDQYIAKRLEWELKETYQREVQAIRLHMKPRALQGDAEEALLTLVSQAHPGCQVGEIFNQKDTDYFLLIEAQAVPPLELQEGAPAAWSGLCQSLGASLQANRSRMVALWVSHDGIAPETFCAIPPLVKFDPDDVDLHFRGLLQEAGLAEEQQQALLLDLREYDGCLPATYHRMKEIVTSLGQGGWQ